MTRIWTNFSTESILTGLLAQLLKTFTNLVEINIETVRPPKFWLATPKTTIPGYFLPLTPS